MSVRADEKHAEEDETNRRMHAACSLLQSVVRRRHAQALITDLRDMVAAAELAPAFNPTAQHEEKRVVRA
jgi:hypothetical protein